MAQSNIWVAFCISKALCRHNHGAGSAPFSSTTAFIKKVHVNDPEEDKVRGNKSGLGRREAEDVEEETAEKIGEASKSAVDMAFDATKGTTEMLKDTVVAEADENVVDTSEYRSIEDNMTRKHADSV